MLRVGGCGLGSGRDGWGGEDGGGGGGGGDDGGGGWGLGFHGMKDWMDGWMDG